MGKVTGAELVVRALRAEGVDTIFTLIGDHILPLADAAVDQGIRFVDTRHESAAMHMADGWARATGRVGTCLVTGGPGHANVIPGLTVAWTSETPIVQISGRPELDQEGLLALQELDQVGMAAPVSKAASMVRRVANVPQAVAWAFHTARAGRPGPVHLTVPMDVQEATIDEDAVPPLPAAGVRGATGAAPAPAAVAEALALLRGAERPLAIVGTPARYQVPPAALQQLAERLRLPVFTVEQARGLLSDEHELCLGYADGALNGAARLIREADALLLVGKRLDYRIGYGRPPAVAADARIVQLDADAAELGRNRTVDMGIQADLGAAVEALAAAAKAGPPTTPAAWLDRLHGARADHFAYLRTLAEDDAAPLHPMRVARAVEPFVDADTRVIVDGGDYVQWPRAYLAARQPGAWQRLGPLGHLGAGLPMALGAKVAAPDARVLLLIGDGSVGFYFMEWDTAIRHRLPIVAVLGNDATWGIDNYFQHTYYGRAVATELRPVRYDRLVADLGGHGEHVEQAADLPAALERAFSAGVPALVDVAVRRVPSPLGEAMAARRLARRA